MQNFFFYMCRYAYKYLEEDLGIIGEENGSPVGTTPRTGTIAGIICEAGVVVCHWGMALQSLSDKYDN